jgi:zinc protease
VGYLQLDRTFAWDTQFERRIAALTPKEVLDTLRRYLQLDRYAVVKAGDFKSSVAAAAPPAAADDRPAAAQN